MTPPWRESASTNLHGHPTSHEIVHEPDKSHSGSEFNPMKSRNPMSMDRFVENPQTKSGSGAAFANGSDNGIPNHSHYVPQFSAATSEILHRLKQGSASLDNALSGLSETARQSDPSTFEETKVRLLQSLNTTLSMPAPDDAQVALHRAFCDFKSGRELVDSQNATLKRKRRTTEHVDFTQSTMAFTDPVSRYYLSARPTPAARVKNEASFEPTSPLAYEAHPVDHRSSRNAAVKRCSICQQSMSLSTDRIVSCRRCAVSAHSHCLSSAHVAKFSDMAEYLCEHCAKIETGVGRLPQSFAERPAIEEHDLEVMRSQRFSQLPASVPLPPKSDILGFDGGSASDFARTEYFYGKTKTDLLNLLSFADEVKPQLLVDILVSVSKKHPDLPLFDTADWASKIPGEEPPFMPPPFTGYRRRHGHKIQVKPRQRHKALKMHLQPATVKEGEAKEGAAGMNGDHEVEEAEEDEEEGEEGEDEEEEAEDSFPSTWPRAGEGLYSKVVPEVEDRNFLADENDEEAFSGFMVDKLGRQIVESAAV